MTVPKIFGPVSKNSPKLHRISETFESELFIKRDEEIGGSGSDNNNNSGKKSSQPSFKRQVDPEKANVEVQRNEHPLWIRAGAAMFYVMSSTVITMANKVVLTSYQFPSYQAVALGQIGTAIVVIFLARELDLIEFPALDRGTFKRIFPLPLLFMGNAYSGLGGTKAVSLPMLTALRKFSILFTIIAEVIVLGSRPSVAIQLSVLTMVLGALVASAKDLSFTFYGYLMVTINNLFTASNGVYIKKKLDTTNFGKYGLLFYNSLYIILPGVVIAELTGDIDKAVEFGKWDNVGFVAAFLSSCFLGFVLNVSMVLCTHVNSALTTMVVGCLKDILITYAGMFIGGDYIFNWINFIGLNICTAGSLFYTYQAFKRKHSEPSNNPKG
ncbi:unnamed protein product [Orchesella dallaii]|uniref:Sugar phosphate transporter domain-containing protein n=1 Tax=Orchesella dallaii TaxID=48710 RepID=A0ABP1PNT6_9HEXA